MKHEEQERVKKKLAQAEIVTAWFFIATIVMSIWIKPTLLLVSIGLLVGLFLALPRLMFWYCNRASDFGEWLFISATFFVSLFLSKPYLAAREELMWCWAFAAGVNYLVFSYSRSFISKSISASDIEHS